MAERGDISPVSGRTSGNQPWEFEEASGGAVYVRYRGELARIRRPATRPELDLRSQLEGAVAAALSDIMGEALASNATPTAGELAMKIGEIVLERVGGADA